MNSLSNHVRKIAIYGAGGFGLETALLIEQINKQSCRWELIGFFDDREPKGKIISGYPVLGGAKTLNKWRDTLYLTLALGMPQVRKSVFAKISNVNISYPVLVHPSAIIGRDVKTGEGSIICAGTIITTNISIGKHVILDRLCTVGHHSIIGDFSSLMPACIISGRVKIGEGTFCGAGAIIVDRRTIGSNVIIGAGGVVIDDVSDDVTEVGVPAKIVKNHGTATSRTI